MSFSLDPTAPLSSDNPQRGAGQINAIAQAVAQLFGLNTGVPIQNGTSPFALSSDGRVTLVADPTAALGAATKRYVDAIGGAGSAAAALTAAAAAQKTADAAVIRNGDTMTGPLVLSGNPTVALGAATKQYVDAALPLGVQAITRLPSSTFTINAVNMETTVLSTTIQAPATGNWRIVVSWGVLFQYVHGSNVSVGFALALDTERSGIQAMSNPAAAFNSLSGSGLFALLLGPLDIVTINLVGIINGGSSPSVVCYRTVADTPAGYSWFGSYYATWMNVCLFRAH